MLLGDDHAIFVEALVTALPQHGFPVVGTARDLAGTLREVRRLRPDICLLDRYFGDGDGDGGGDGVDRLPEIAAAGGGTRIVVLTADTDAAAVHRALVAGASGYVNKMCGLESLIEALRGVARGETVVQMPGAHVPDQPRRSASADARRLAAYLTARESQCLGLLVEGACTTAMARTLGVSTTTVRTHVQSILTKLGVHSRLEAASFAMRHHLLRAPDALRAEPR